MLKVICIGLFQSLLFHKLHDVSAGKNYSLFDVDERNVFLKTTGVFSGRNVCSFPPRTDCQSPTIHIKFLTSTNSLIIGKVGKKKQGK